MNSVYTASMLDDRERLKQIDPSGMLQLVDAVPDHCREAVEIVQRADIPTWTGISRVVILGMGGSAIGGNLARSLVEETCPVPVFVNSDYTIPGYVDASTLVIASSYSGNTEESLLGYAASKERGARIIAISAGGKLAELAQADGFPWVKIPGGMSPRAALGYSFFTLMLIFERLGLAEGVSDAVGETLDILEKQRAAFGYDVPFDQNPMKQLALKLAGRIPLVYGSGGWRGVVAYRWKCQVNENSKALCFWNTFPELNHNETVGWEHPELTQEFHVVFLRDQKDHPRIQKRVEVTQQLMTGRIAGMTELWAEGDSSLARLMSLVYPGDYASYYLALLYGADPTPIQVIDRLKDELAAMDR